MTKDVEAAFVNSSSDENDETNAVEGKKVQNSHVENVSKLRMDDIKSLPKVSFTVESKSRRKKTYR